jgi:hypothetical protein
MYSAPWRLVGKQLWVRATKASVQIFCDDVRVAVHPRVAPGRRSTDANHLPAERGEYRHRSRGYWEARADAIGVEVGVYIREVFDSDDVLDQLRAVQAMVSHLAKHTPERARNACIRARFYGAYHYGELKSILRKGLDMQPLPSISSGTAVLADPRFVRSVRELLDHDMESEHEPN